MLTFRVATPADCTTIATIHAESWQENYQGAFTTEYLNNEVLEDRLTVWAKRFDKSPENQHIIIAEKDNKVIAFACLIGNEDIKYGTLLDNLHVSVGQKGQGVGAALLQKSRDWAATYYPDTPFYLWVLCSNTGGIRFYERYGGQQVEKTIHHSPKGKEVDVFRYVWY